MYKETSRQINVTKYRHEARLLSNQVTALNKHWQLTWIMILICTLIMYWRYIFKLYLHVAWLLTGEWFSKSLKRDQVPLANFSLATVTTPRDESRVAPVWNARRIKDRLPFLYASRYWLLRQLTCSAMLSPVASRAALQFLPDSEERSNSEQRWINIVNQTADPCSLLSRSDHSAHWAVLRGAVTV